VEDLVLQNMGTAENDTLSKLYLYRDKGMAEELGAAFVSDGANPKALFEDLDFVVPRTGVTYVYLGALVKGIDYSASPRPEATAQAGATISLKIPANSGSYATRVRGATSGDYLGTSGLPSGTTRTSTVYGAIISGLSTDFPDSTLFNGTAEDIFSFNVTVPESNNLDPAGEPLGVKLQSITFTVSGGTDVSLGNFRVYRVGGSSGERAASASYSAAQGRLSVNFPGTYGSLSDLTIRPGTTAEYAVRADISGVNTNDTLRLTIEDINDNFTYSHPISAVADINGIAPLISGLMHLRGGALAN